jgi:hypothetical protein
MPFSLDQVIPWGRSLGEYLRMFAFQDRELGGAILGVADGPAAFNAALSRWGGRVVSADPLYRYSPNEIGGRIGEVYDQVIRQLEENRDAYVWREFSGPTALGRARLRAMDEFLDDLERGKREGRYLPAALPSLPFHDGRFDLALCSHLLFTYSERLDSDFHVAAALELVRVASEARIFPLLDLAGRPSPHVEPVCAALEEAGFEVEKVRVGYEFQRGGNEMLRIRRS